MFVYLGVFASLSLFALVTPDRKSTLFFLLSSAFLIWFMGFRYETGCDYHGYLHRWQYFPDHESWVDILREEEPGFGLLTWAVKASGLGYTWLNVAASLILVACYASFARAHRFAPTILALLFPVIIVQLGMSGIRQALAGGFLMLAINALIRKEKFWTAFWVLVGMQFHTSVVMFLPLALLAGRNISTIRLAVAFSILGPVSALLLADRFETYSDRYIEQIYGTVTSGGAIIRYIMIFFPVPILFLYRRKVFKAFPELYQFLRLFALLIASLAPLVVLSSIALHRLNYYVMPMSILVLVYTGSIVFRGGRMPGHILALSFYGTYSFLWFATSKHARICYIPYENTLFLDQSIAL